MHLISIYSQRRIKFVYGAIHYLRKNARLEILMDFVMSCNVACIIYLVESRHIYIYLDNQMFIQLSLGISKCDIRKHVHRYNEYNNNNEYIK